LLYSIRRIRLVFYHLSRIIANRNKRGRWKLEKSVTDKDPIPYCDSEKDSDVIFIFMFQSSTVTHRVLLRRVVSIVSKARHVCCCWWVVGQKQFFGVLYYKTAISRCNSSVFTTPSIPSIKMKVLVGVKRVVDYAVKVRVTKGTVDLGTLKHSINPFCEVSEYHNYNRYYIAPSKVKYLTKN
jgi:hypothetical protein